VETTNGLSGLTSQRGQGEKVELPFCMEFEQFDKRSAGAILKDVGWEKGGSSWVVTSSPKEINQH